jgi:hypothetical protein
MQLHDHLYALGLQAGREVFDDPERLRGALAGAQADPGEVELVVDAVRRGAYRALLTDLDAGADPTRAIEETAARLAGSRGCDPASAAWALAVLGFAVGRVGENDVRRYRGGGPATPSHGTYLPPQPTHQPSQQPAPTYSAPQQYAAPVPARAATRSRTPLLLAVGGTLAAVVVAVVLALVLAGGGGDDDPQAGDDSTSETSETTSGTTSDATDPTSDPTTEDTPEVATISTEASFGYTTALATFATDYEKAGKMLQRATRRDDVPAALEAARQLRIAVYDFDLTTRDLDLSPIQPTVNDFLTASGKMITALDETYATAESVLEVNAGVAALPADSYVASFQKVQDEITANQSGS